MKKSTSAARSFLSFNQCFICREWSGFTSKSYEVELCLPCYVDILEIRQARGVMAEGQDADGDDRVQPGSGNSPSPSDSSQLGLFD